MSGSTSLGIPYPQSTDDVRPYEDMQDLAEAVDDLFVGDRDAWDTYTPTFTSISGSPNMGSTGALVGRYKQIGKTVHLSIFGSFAGTGASAGTGAWSFSLPVAAATTGTVHRTGGAYLRDASPATNYMGGCLILTSAPTVLNAFYNTTQVGSTGPFSWVTGDAFVFSITYEAA